MKRLAGLTGMMTALAFLVSGAAIGQTKSMSESTTSTAHIESTTKHKGPGPNTKTKSEMVIGTVKSYEAGKSIVVTGPKDKEYSFDLDLNVATKGTINVGERVKVGYTKTGHGEKVTTVVSYPAASHTKKTKKTAA